jgi:hypothetical protein
VIVVLVNVDVHGSGVKMCDHLQSTQSQYNSNANLATGPQLQAAEQWHRSNNSRDVGKDSQRRLREIERWSVHANARRNIFKHPAGTDRVTAEDVCEHSCDRVSHDEGEEGPDDYCDVSAEEYAEVE